jgi:diketogulonate reductase-like aldo/keto reductase
MWVSDMDISIKFKLNNDISMPALGLGVYQTKRGEETINAVTWALELGYRHIDTAMIYHNEPEVGQGIVESGIPRDEVFITTKLWNSDHGFEKTLKAFDSSIKRLKVDYLDLYLIHWPQENIRKDTWKAFEKLYNDKLVKAIGVSNYTIEHLKGLLSYCEVVPAVNQVEFNTYLYQKELLEFCQSMGIRLEAYSPIARGEKLKDKKLIDMASKYKKTPAQILLRWSINHDVIVIPKSSHKERIKENSEIFDFNISEEDMKLLDSFNENFRTCWDPTNVR